MSGLHVTLGQLKAFAAVARLGGVSRAAQHLHVTQPAVSKKLRLLQEEVGLPLIEQIGRRQHLTEAGEALLTTCAGWLDIWEQFEQAVADLKGLKQGHLRLCVVTTGKYFMPRVLGPFCDLYPGIDIAMEVANRDRLLERLEANRDDLYVMGLPPEDARIESEPLMENPLVVLAPAAHPWRQRHAIPFADLAQTPLIMRENGSGTRITIERAFAARGLTPRVRLEIGSNEAIKQAVAGGLGLAILSRSTLAHDGDASDLVALDVEGFPIRRSWYVVWPRGKQLSVVARTFLAFLHAHIGRISGTDPGARSQAEGETSAFAGSG